MTPENFCYWLQGYFEISSSDMIGKTQKQIIKDHLDLVFKKETPKYEFKTDPNIAPAPFKPYQFETLPPLIQPETKPMDWYRNQPYCGLQPTSTCSTGTNIPFIC